MCPHLPPARRCVWAALRGEPSPPWPGAPKYAHRRWGSDFPAAAVPEIVEEMEAEEVTNFAEIMPAGQLDYREEKQFIEENPFQEENTSTPLSQEQLFEKLQNYKKLLDNGLILQGEYDALKKEILSKM